jgi:hypothetical protein
MTSGCSEKGPMCDFLRRLIISILHKMCGVTDIGFMTNTVL